MRSCVQQTGPPRLDPIVHRCRPTEPIVISWSGGKDSALTLAALRDEGRYEPVALLTSLTAGHDTISVHGVRGELLRAQARAIGLPLYEMWLAERSSNHAYEAAFASAASSACARHGARHVAFGDLFLEDVRRYREERLPALGMEGVFPLWGLDTAELARAFVAKGFAARLVCVDTHALPATFTGRLFDAGLLTDLPAGVDPCGERGEFHTFVSDGPGFHQAVPYHLGEVVVRDERFAYCDLLPQSAHADPIS